MKKVFSASNKFYLLGGLMLVITSCSKDLEDAQLALNQKVEAVEVKTILETDEYLSAVDDVVTELFQSGASAKSSQKIDCYTADFSETGYTVTFDNCSVEEGGESITGTIMVTYNIGEEDSAFTATYSDLMVGQITVNGTRSFTLNSSANQESFEFTILSDMSIELEDGSLIEESGQKDFGITIDSENFLNSALSVSGNWTIKADGNTYIVTTTSPLEISLNCEHIGKGNMKLNKNGLEVTLNFGDGTCDNLVTLTYPNGVTEEISFE